MTATYVWYAAYGSNCDDGRFRGYLPVVACPARPDCTPVVVT